MNIQIHLSIASALKDIIEEELPIKINTPAFLFGSIKPDLFPQIITAVHEIKYSKKFIEDEIKSLLKDTIINNQCSWEFSERIGIITHYLSDFFCYVHSDMYKGTTLYHYYYELKHLKYIFRSFKAIIRKINKCETLYIDLNYVNEFLVHQYNSYMSTVPSAGRDLMYSLETCATVCFSIIVSVISGVDYHKNNKEIVLLHSA